MGRLFDDVKPRPVRNATNCPFNIGDIVRCVDVTPTPNDRFGAIKVGRLYKVTARGTEVFRGQRRNTVTVEPIRAADWEGWGGNGYYYPTVAFVLEEAAIQENSNERTTA